MLTDNKLFKIIKEYFDARTFVSTRPAPGARRKASPEGDWSRPVCQVGTCTYHRGSDELSWYVPVWTQMKWPSPLFW